jgi:HPt (histidine-containing phosphotransfer) domain-containing protein
MSEPLDPRALYVGVAPPIAPRSRDAVNVAGAGGVSADAANPLVGAEPPILDTQTFDHWTTLLPPNKIAAYLESLGRIRESVAQEPQLSDASNACIKALAQNVHKLAGSAGMFGLERVANISRRLERALETGTADVTDMADHLGTAITATLAVIQDRMSHSGKSG